MTNQEYIQSEYLKNRYMENLTDQEFMERFNLVFENLCFIDDNAKISVGSVEDNNRLFWMNHWIVICAEAEKRTLFPNQIMNSILQEKTHKFLRNINIEKLKKIRSDIGSNIYFYKFGKRRFLDKIRTKGEILLRPASFYSDSSLNYAIKDDELTRFYVFNQRYKSLKAGMEINNEYHELTDGIYKKNINSDYYIFCLSNGFEPRLFNDFDSDACLIIKSPGDFLSRLSNTLPENIFKFSFGNVSYFDPLLDDPLSVTIPFSKNFKYTYQNEIRAVFMPYEIKPQLDTCIINVGDISDFSEIVDIEK